MELQRNADQAHIYLERNLRELHFLAWLPAHPLLLLDCFVSLLLSSHVLGLSLDAQGFEHEALDLVHVIGVVLFDCHLVLADIVKKLLEQRIIRVLQKIEEVLIDYLQKPFVTFINSTVVDQWLRRLDYFLDVFEGFGTAFWLPALVF